MNEFIAKLFKNKTLDQMLAKRYGFVCHGDEFVVCKNIDDEFVLEFVWKDCASCKVIEIASGEPYALVFAPSSQGSFVGKLKEKCCQLLEDICKNCFKQKVFSSSLANKVIEYISTKYGDKLEFLWEKFEDSAIWRRSDNKKWYALLTKVPKKYLAGNESRKEKIEALVLRVGDGDAAKLIDQKTFFEAYHMNKKNWVSVVLESDISADKVFELVDRSFLAAKKK